MHEAASSALMTEPPSAQLVVISTVCEFITGCAKISTLNESSLADSMRTRWRPAHSSLVNPESPVDIDHLSASPNDAISIPPRAAPDRILLSPVMQEE